MGRKRSKKNEKDVSPNNKKSKKDFKDEVPSEKSKQDVRDECPSKKSKQDLSDKEVSSPEKNLSASIHKFTYALYETYVEDKLLGNFVSSPLCVHLILAMATCGARGHTAETMTMALRLSAARDIRDYLPDFKKFIEKLSCKEYNENYQCYEKLHIANQVFVHTLLASEIETRFKSTLRTYFKSYYTKIDFGKKEKADEIINKWCKEQTVDTARSLSSGGFDGPPTSVMLLSTIYCKLSWKYPFNVDNTGLLPFYVDKNQTIDVPTMNQQGYFCSVEISYMDALFVTIPYQIEGFSMMIVMPNKGIDALRHMENYLNFLDLHRNIPQHKCHLYLPKFRIENNYDLCLALKKLGMPLMFEHSKANFNGIMNQIVPPLCMNKVLQKCCISVDERGMETTITDCVNVHKKGTCETGGVEQIFVNKPFLYMIKNEGTILFIGRVYNPLD